MASDQVKLSAADQEALGNIKAARREYERELRQLEKTIDKLAKAGKALPDDLTRRASGTRDKIRSLKGKEDQKKQLDALLPGALEKLGLGKLAGNPHVRKGVAAINAAKGPALRIGGAVAVGALAVKGADALNNRLISGTNAQAANAASTTALLNQQQNIFRRDQNALGTQKSLMRFRATQKRLQQTTAQIRKEVDPLGVKGLMGQIDNFLSGENSLLTESKKRAIARIRAQEMLKEANRKGAKIDSKAPRFEAQARREVIDKFLFDNKDALLAFSGFKSLKAFANLGMTQLQEMLGSTFFTDAVHADLEQDVKDLALQKALQQAQQIVAAKADAVRRRQENPIFRFQNAEFRATNKANAEFQIQKSVQWNRF